MSKKRTVTIKLNAREAEDLENAINEYLQYEDRCEGEEHTEKLTNRLKKVLDAISILTGSFTVDESRADAEKHNAELEQWRLENPYCKHCRCQPCQCREVPP